MRLGYPIARDEKLRTTVRYNRKWHDAVVYQTYLGSLGSAQLQGSNTVRLMPTSLQMSVIQDS